MALWPRVMLQNDLESLMTRLNEIPGRVQEWKKSSAQCGAEKNVYSVGLRRYKIEDFVPCLDGTLLCMEGKLGNLDM